MEAAWCLELHAWLEAVARRDGITLLLMGGQGAAMRMEVAVQRGSADNDYLTSASPEEIEALVAALEEALSPLAQQYRGCFRLRPLTGRTGGRALPLRTWAIPVPNLLERSAAPIEVKLEFHLEPDLPQSEDLDDAKHFARFEPVRARLPARPYQVALKLLTMAPEPVGIDEPRAYAIPRQLYDIDALIARFGPKDWNQLFDGMEHRFRSEARRLGQTAPAAENLWDALDARLAETAERMGNPAFFRLVQTFQGTQLFTGTRRPPAEWQARTRRIQFAWQIARVPGTAASNWERALALEERIPASPAGPTAPQLNALLPPGLPARCAFWEALATTATLETFFNQVQAAL